MKGFLVTLGLLLAGCRSNPSELRFDRYGGVVDLKLAATGFFRVQEGKARQWLVTPEGHAFFSFGVNHVTADATTIYNATVSGKFSDLEAWAKDVAVRYRDWRLNTIGAWSANDLFTGKLPYTPIVELARLAPNGDFFDPAFEANVAAAVTVVARPDDPWIIGYFTDNELRWTRDTRDMSHELFTSYVALPAAAPGKAAVVQFLSGYYGGDINAFNGDWKESLPSFDALYARAELPAAVQNVAVTLPVQRAFLRRVADRYFSITSAALRQADPNHLILGCRLVSILTPRELPEAAAPYVDVLSVNKYNFLPGLSETANELFGPVLKVEPFLAEHAALSKRPLLVSEFGFRAADAGLPNTYPPVFPVYANQTKRADAFEAYVRNAFTNPAVVGLHWFEHVDEPAEGRPSDGENDNWGLVNKDDVPYSEVIERMRSLYREELQAAVDAERR